MLQRHLRFDTMVITSGWVWEMLWGYGYVVQHRYRYSEGFQSKKKEISPADPMHHSDESIACPYLHMCSVFAFDTHRIVVWDLFFPYLLCVHICICTMWLHLLHIWLCKCICYHHVLELRTRYMAVLYIWWVSLAPWTCTHVPMDMYPCTYGYVPMYHQICTYVLLNMYPKKTQPILEKTQPIFKIGCVFFKIGCVFCGYMLRGTWGYMGTCPGVHGYMFRGTWVHVYWYMGTWFSTQQCIPQIHVTYAEPVRTMDTYHPCNTSAYHRSSPHSSHTDLYHTCNTDTHPRSISHMQHRCISQI